MESLFDTISGLPVHPLVVHFAVVMLLIAISGLILSIYLPKVRKNYAFIATVGILIGTGAAFIAKQSGEALAERIGNPADHADYGNILSWVSIAYLALAIFWYRKFRVKDKPLLVSHLTALAGVVVMGLTFLTGHSGAQAVWQGRLETPKPATTQSPTSEKSTSSGITLTEIAKHANGASCWSAIDSQVYDLTDWISKHPGGATVIEAICGKDGSASFNGQHLGERRPAEFLASYKIGTLG